MKEELHPPYLQATVTCACGNTFTVGSTKAEIQTEVCSACHPFYTGQKRIVDSAGRVERFTRMVEKSTVKRSTTTPKKTKAKKEADASKTRKLG